MTDSVTGWAQSMPEKPNRRLNSSNSGTYSSNEDLNGPHPFSAETL